MKQDHEIYDGLRRAVGDLTPDIFDKISSPDVFNTISQSEMNLSKNNEIQDTQIASDREKVKSINSNGKKITKRTKFLSGLVAACLVICISSGLQYYNHFVSDSIISIDVNPSIELVTNKSGQILDVIPLNDDGIAVLDGMNLSKVDLDVAINAITGSMVKQGFLIDGSANVLVSVENKDFRKAETLTDVIVTDFENALSLNHLKGSVLSQTIPTGDPTAVRTDLDAFAKKHKISYGKALFVYNLVQKDSSLSADELADLPLRDISALIKDKKLDIKDIIKCDSDDSLYENIEDGIEDINEQHSTSGNTSVVSSDAKHKVDSDDDDDGDDDSKDNDDSDSKADDDSAFKNDGDSDGDDGDLPESLEIHTDKSEDKDSDHNDDSDDSDESRGSSDSSESDEDD